MCGIVGVIGDKVKKDIIDGLKDLEYRGYDSAGVLIKNNDKMDIVKSIGNIDTLRSKCDNLCDGKLGLGHTRWATHGKPTLENCHPHCSEDSKWNVVHNGIIENFLSLKIELEKENLHFYSDTDTEVIAKLLGNTKGTTPLNVISKAISRLQGSFALGIVNAEHNKLYATKRISPLYIGITKDRSILSSDISVIGKYTKEYIRLDDDEVAIISLGSVAVYKDLKQIKKEIYTIDQEESVDIVVEESYMKKEILETKNKVLDTLESIDYSHIPLTKYDEIILIGCGTAYHSANMGSRYINQIAKKPSQSYIASEYRYGDYVINKNALYVFVSQSGETADTVACAELIKNQADTLALTNVKYCNLNSTCKYVALISAGKEIGVASTKAYACQLSALLILSYNLADIDTTSITHKAQSLSYAQYNYNKLIKKITSLDKVFFIGRDMDYITAMESALKLKEISYINCMAIPSGELKHGTLALIDNKSLVIVIETIERLHDKTLNNISEIKARGGNVVVFSTKPKECFKDIDDYFTLSNSDTYLNTISSITPFHLLAYDTCISLGLNPDQPRNLAKSVTVE